MVVLRGNIDDSIIVEEHTDLRGNVMGDVIVRPGQRLELRGNVMGDLILEGDAEAIVKGNLMGDVRRVM